MGPECDFCYAELMMGGLGDEPVKGEGRRLRRVKWGPDGERSFCKQGWSDLRKWNRAAARNGGIDPELGRRRWVFINSLSDFFDSHPSVIWRAPAWQLFRELEHLILILVTKRPHLIARELPEFWDEIAHRVILITTAGNDEWAARRVPDLLHSCDGRAAPAIFGVSAEPLIGSLSLRPWLHHTFCPAGTSSISSCRCADLPRDRLLRWVIGGGESGSKARPCHPAWGESLLDQSIRAQVAFHWKQNGEFAPFAPLTPTIHDDPPVAIGDVRRVLLRPGDRNWHGAADMIRVGKAKAGHLLRGREYLERPVI